MSEVENSINVIAIPENLEDINPAWLSLLLQFPISTSNFVATPNAHAGSGFLSEIVRISCEKTDGTPLKLIIKLLPQGDSSNTEFAKNMVIDAGFDIREINFYSTLARDLVQVLPDLKNYFCKFYTGFVTENPRSSVLVLDDMKPAGYSTVNWAGYLSQGQIEESVRFMAKFHYAGTALESKKKKPLQEAYPFLQNPDKDDPTNSAFFTAFIGGMNKLDAFFEKENCSAGFREYFNKLMPDQISIFTKVFKVMNENATLIHGDLWSNNMLVSDDEKSIKIIDWQLVACGDPTFDLAVVIVSILPPERLNRKEVDTLLRLYYDMYANLFKSHDQEELLPRNWEDFSTCFYTYAMAFVFAWFSYGPYPFSLNFQRLVKIYDFLRVEMDINSFLLTL